MHKSSNKRETAAPSTAANRPVDTIRHGNLKCVLWKNEGEKGAWYNVDLVRTFRDESGFHDTNKFPADDLLRVAFLAEQAYSRVLELKADDKAAAAEQEGVDEPAPY